MNHLTLFKGQIQRKLDYAEDGLSNYNFPRRAPVYKITTDAFEQDVICSSYSDFKEGDEVLGIACWIENNAVLGYCLPKDYLVLLDKYKNISEAFLEYESFRYNLYMFMGKTGKWPTNDNVSQMPVEQGIYWAKINSCQNKWDGYTLTTHYFAKMKTCEGNIEFVKEVDYDVPDGSNIALLAYKAGGSCHPFAIAPRFSDWLWNLYENDNATYLLVNDMLKKGDKGKSILLNTIGRHLYLSDSRKTALTADNQRIRVMLISPDTARALSVGRTNEKFYLTEFPYTDRNDKLLVGNVYEATLEDSRLVNFEIVQMEYNASSTEDETQRLLTVREAEKNVFINERYQIFDSSKFCIDVQKGLINTLHFELLEWIAMFKYCTGKLAFRLFDCGLIPRYPNELTLSQRELVDKIKNAAATLKYNLNENGVIRELEARNPNDTKQKNANKFLLKLSDQGLLNTASFSPNGAKFHVLTDSGQLLLKAQNRYKKYDSFSILREPRVVKQILSGNQLMIALYEMLSGNTHRISHDDIIMDTYMSTSSADSDDTSQAAHLLFKMSVHDNDAETDRQILICGDSIRNTAGLSKDFDKLEIEEKLPRLLATVNKNITADIPVVLAHVFTTYKEMCYWANYIEGIASQMNDFKIKLLYTYDYAILGKPGNSFFEWGSKAQKPVLIGDISDYFKKLYPNQAVCVE